MERNWLYKFIVYSKKDKKLLLSSESKGLSLPYYRPKVSHVAVTNHIGDYFAKEHQLKTNVLRCYRQIDNIRIYVVEVLDEGNLISSDTTWVYISDFNNFDELSNFDSSVLKDWLSVSNPSVLPWFKFGWRKKMEMWVENILSNNSLKFEQIRSWERSAIFKINSEYENYYFKAVPDVFSHEPLVSHYLYQTHPSYVPEIINMETEQKWYIMKELQGPLLPAFPTICNDKSYLTIET